MKKFTKLFLSCAAIAALTATVAVSAMAEEVTINMKGETPTTATYDTETGKITFVAPKDMDTTKAATFVAFPSTASATDLKDADIVGIDQTDKGVGFENVGLKGKPQKDDENKTTYTVKLGYYAGDQFKILEGTLFSSGIVLGRVNADDKINLSDATCVIKHFAKVELLTGDAVIAANVNDDDKVNLSDATCIIKYFAKVSEGTGHVGETR